MWEPERKRCPQTRIGSRAAGLRRRRQQPASDPLAPEPFADEKVLDAEPVAKCLAGQSAQLPARSVLKEYADGNTLGCLTVAVIVFPQHLMDLMDIAFVSVVRDSDIHIHARKMLTAL